MANRFRKLRMEQMEAREMMAGDITAYVEKGSLFINEAKNAVGKDQGVLITQLANGNIRVQGQATSSSGVASRVNNAAFADFGVPFNFASTSRNLYVNLGAGSDEVVVDVRFGAVPEFQNASFNVGSSMGTDNDKIIVWAMQTRGSMWVDTGIGNDWVFLSGATIGDGYGSDLLSIKTGAGADTVTIKNDSRVRGSVDIQTYSALSETDIDTVYFDTNTVVDGTVSARLGGGADNFLVTDPSVSQIYWGGLTAGSISVDMGDGNDVVRTRGVSTSAGNFQLFTGAGADNVTINNKSIAKLDGTYFICTIRGNLEVQTYYAIGEADADMLEVLDASIENSLIARMGGGNDYFALTDADYIRNDLDLRMDAGNDTAYIDGYVGDHIMAWLGEGDDTLTIGRIWAYRLLMDGNVGTDRLYTSSEMYAQYFDYLGWEYINGRRSIWDPYAVGEIKTKA